MSLHEKVARAEQLRGELSGLRAGRELAHQLGHEAIVDKQLDLEIKQLEAQVEGEKNALVEATGAGSVEEALRAMNLAVPSSGESEFVVAPESVAPVESVGEVEPIAPVEPSKPAKSSGAPALGVPIAGSKEK